VAAGGGSNLVTNSAAAAHATPSLQELPRSGASSFPNDEDDAVDLDRSSIAELVSRHARQDLGLDRREATRAIAGTLFGVPLLERVERWLTSAEPPTTSRRTAGIGYQEIEQIEHAARLFKQWDHQFGGGLRRKAVVGQLAEIADELRDFSHPADLTRRLHGSMAQLAQTAATMCWDSGNGRLAQQYYLLALRAAGAAEDHAFRSNILAGMARQQLSLGRVAEGLELVRLATDGADGRVTPAVRAMLSTREAWAYAKQGRLAAFRRATSRAEDHLRDLDKAVEPYWISYFDEAEFAGVTGGRLLEAAQASPRHAEEAAIWLRQAVELRDDHCLRSAALDQIGFAEVRLIQGEYDEAARLGNEALTTVEQTQSSRVRVKLTTFYRHSVAAASVPAIADLRSRIKPVLNAASAA
jgi:tetratricopeptide (TPR) repeat protein